MSLQSGGRPQRQLLAADLGIVADVHRKPGMGQELRDAGGVRVGGAIARSSRSSVPGAGAASAPARFSGS
ncbi:hypothetical protein HH299_12140 [Xanthomonas sp. Kuri4-2]